MTRKFAVVHEGEPDFTMATLLADRVICEHVNWIDPTDLDSHRTWIDRNQEGRRLDWAGMPDLAKSVNFRPRGKFNDEPGQLDAAAARKAIIYLKATIPDLKAVLLIRDQDNKTSRRVGLEQARSGDHKVAVVVGLAALMREAWLLCAFEPADESEQARLDKARGSYNVNPVMNSHELRGAKKALSDLCGGDRDREHHGLLKMSLDELAERGKHNGLAAFLVQVKSELVAVF